MKTILVIMGTIIAHHISPLHWIEWVLLSVVFIFAFCVDIIQGSDDFIMKSNQIKFTRKKKDGSK